SGGMISQNTYSLRCSQCRRHKNPPLPDKLTYLSKKGGHFIPKRRTPHLLIFDWAVNNIRMGIVDESPVLVIERAKVSILERAIPFAACAIASISGAFGGYRMVRVFTELARAEDAGFDVVFGAVNEIN